MSLKLCQRQAFGTQYSSKPGPKTLPFIPQARNDCLQDAYRTDIVHFLIEDTQKSVEEFSHIVHHAIHPDGFLFFFTEICFKKPKAGTGFEKAKPSSDVLPSAEDETPIHVDS